ncbi:DUF397 domain-containing protein [Streptomyces sp. ISL-12]|uniref:DUF397 domain-containing protein n=1 Tax=Streptomyces sp. ISL-12 TaxID=2819177 RepID=UPI001BEADA06|nr:DUF397 domain-containing protein [Streptomyces sp. ISL-12]MBT2411963.1 DUF397 domain-containing protein [Streptomyces sp. ISL-12]
MTLSEHAWFKSSYSDPGQNCVEAALLPSAIAVRDSKHSAGPVLHLSPTAWHPFLTHLTERGPTSS